MTARTVPIELDKSRNLRYPMRSVKRLKAECDINLFALDDTAMADPGTVGAVLWAGLVHEDPELPVDAVDDMYDLCDLGRISEAIADAMGGGNTEDPLGKSSE